MAESNDDIRKRTVSARAEDDLRFIRGAMERASSFTCVPGVGQILVGLTAFPAARISSRAAGDLQAVWVWIVDAALAVTIAIAAIVRKSRRIEVTLDSASTRRFLQVFLPPLGAAMVLTVVLVQAARFDLVRPLWLLLYGTGLMTGGAFSIRLVPIMGLSFVALGLAAFLSPSSWGDPYMVAGFGVVHIAFGIVIARWHGG